MARRLKVGAAQLGPIQLADARAGVVRRLCAMLRESHRMGARLVVFPELALTTFFAGCWYDELEEIDAWFERAMPNAATAPLVFNLARDLGVLSRLRRTRPRGWRRLRPRPRRHCQTTGVRQHRRIEHYGLITERTAALPPPG